MSLQPFRQGICGSLFQEINRATSFQIDEYGSISLSFTDRLIIYAKHF
jgi:hypothetical protein